MQTLKLKYRCFDEGFKETFETYQKQYSVCLHYMVNRVSDTDGNISEKELRAVSHFINNIDKLDSWFIQSAIGEANSLFKSFKSRVKEHEDVREKTLKDLEFKHSIGKLSDHQYSAKKKKALSPLKLVFGGKNNLSKRQTQQITKEEFKQNRLAPLYSVGEAPGKGNRKFNINSDLSLLFKPNSRQHFNLSLKPGKNQEKMLQKLFSLASDCKIALSFKLSRDFVFISYDNAKVEAIYNLKKVENRVLGIDLNPNYIGWSIADWKSSSEFNLVDSGVYSFKKINDEHCALNSLGDVASDDPRRIYLSDKRNYETIKVAENIIAKAVHHKCQIISIEDLNIPAKDRDKGKNYNALCNNSWLRTLLVWQLEKRAVRYGIKLLKVKPQYSSFIGNFLFRSLDKPDMILSSIELGRRGYEFYSQYITKTKQEKKNIIQPNTNDFKEFWRMSKEELIPEFNGNGLIELYDFIKSKKSSLGSPNEVRIRLEELPVRRFFSTHSNIYI